MTHCDEPAKGFPCWTGGSRRCSVPEGRTSVLRQTLAAELHNQNLIHQYRSLIINVMINVIFLVL